MDPYEQIKILQKLCHDYQEHNLKLIEEVHQLRAQVEVPRDMQQEANLKAREELPEATRRRIEWLEEEVGKLTLTSAGFKDSFNECLRNLREVEAERDEFKNAAAALTVQGA
jgi:lipoate-protein ligase A